jgi:hypothetical protein
MANKPNVENRWWVETTVKRPRKPEQARPDPGTAGQGKPDEAGFEETPAQLDVAAGFYTVASDYNQDRAKEDLTDNNLRIARAANPQPGQWVFVAMTKEHYPERLIKRIKDEFRLPREARGVLLDHGRVVRLLVCGPQLEDWMLDVTLSDEPDVPRAAVQTRRGGAAPGTALGAQPDRVSAAARRALPRRIAVAPDKSLHNVTG